MNEAVLYTIIAIFVLSVGIIIRKEYINIVCGILNFLIALEVMNIDYKYSFLIIVIAFGNFLVIMDSKGYLNR